jgi:hypothetical protein
MRRSVFILMICLQLFQGCKKDKPVESQNPAAHDYRDKVIGLYYCVIQWTSSPNGQPPSSGEYFDTIKIARDPASSRNILLGSDIYYLTSDYKCGQGPDTTGALDYYYTHGHFTFGDTVKIYTVYNYSGLGGSSSTTRNGYKNF